VPWLLCCHGSRSQELRAHPSSAQLTTLPKLDLADPWQPHYRAEVRTQVQRDREREGEGERVRQREAERGRDREGQDRTDLEEIQLRMR
jgi:hypothetical protein